MPYHPGVPILVCLDCGHHFTRPWLSKLFGIKPSCPKCGSQDLHVLVF